MNDGETGGVYISDVFKQFSDHIPDISDKSDIDIYLEDMNKIFSKHWLVAMTLITDQPDPLSTALTTFDKEFEQSSVGDLEFSCGFINKIGFDENPSNNEPTFVMGLRYDDPVNFGMVQDDSDIYTDIFVSGLLLDTDLPNGINAMIHSARALSPDEYEMAENGDLEPTRILRALPTNRLTGHVSHVACSGYNTDFQILANTFDFLDYLDDDSKVEKIETAFGMAIDGIKARTLEQGYLTLYTSLNYLISDIGQQSRSAKSEAQMALKMADNEIITQQRAINWVEKLEEIHSVRSDILWGAETIDEDEFDYLLVFFSEFVMAYFEFWKEKLNINSLTSV